MQYSTDYLQWKSWNPTDFGGFTMREEVYFGQVVALTGSHTSNSTRMLELGFGNGAFLGFGKANGWHMAGVELNPELLETAGAAGFEVMTAESLAKAEAGSFDVAVAFDVLEHIPQDQLAAYLQSIRRLLKPGGHLVARFPNGDSPFGSVYQNGDPTHVTFLGSEKAALYGTAAGFEVVIIRGDLMPFWSGSIKRLAQAVIARAIGALVDLTVANIIFNGRRVAFCSPNLLVVFKVPA